MKSRGVKSVRSFVLCGLLCSLSAWAGPQCQIEGEFVVYEARDSLKIGICRRDPLGIGYNNPYHADDLLRIVEKNKSDKKFIASLNQVGVGKDYASAVAEIKAFGGMLAIQGGDEDRSALQYLARVMNDSEGVTERIKDKRERERNERDAREARDRTPVAVTMDSLKKMIDQNRAVAATMNPEQCRSLRPETLSRLKILKVKFADGEESLMLPYDGQELGKNVFEFASPTSGKGLGGLQFGDVPGKRRYIKFENGKFFWGVQADKDTGGTVTFKEYEVSSFHEISAKDALGWARPVAAGETYDQCFYARVIGPKGAGNSSGSSAIK